MLHLSRKWQKSHSLIYSPKDTKMKSPLIAAALITSLIVPQAVAGSSSIEPFKVAVQVDRAALEDVSTISDEYERIHEQIADRCASEHSDFTALQKYIAVRSCVNSTMDQTVSQIDHAGLTDLHTQKRFG